MARKNNTIDEFLRNNQEVNFVLVKHFRGDKYLSVVFNKNGDVRRNEYLDQINQIIHEHNSAVNKVYGEMFTSEEHPGRLKKAILGPDWTGRPNLLAIEYERGESKSGSDRATDIYQLFSKYTTEKRRELVDELTKLDLSIDKRYLETMCGLF